VAKLVCAEWIKKQNRNQQISEDDKEIEAPVPEADDSTRLSVKAVLTNVCGAYRTRIG
jgi:hypothetical protein